MVGAEGPVALPGVWQQHASLTETPKGCVLGLPRAEQAKTTTVLMGAKLSFVRKVLEMDGCDSCTTVWMYLVPLNCTLKNG